MPSISSAYGEATEELIMHHATRAAGEALDTHRG